MALFLDSGDKGSSELNQYNESDLDLDDLEAKEEDTDAEEEACWTDQLDDFQVPQFVPSTGII